MQNVETSLISKCSFFLCMCPSQRKKIKYYRGTEIIVGTRLQSHHLWHCEDEVILFLRRSSLALFLSSFNWSAKQDKCQECVKSSPRQLFSITSSHTTNIKKNHCGDTSCDIEESAVWFRRDASMREVAAVTSSVHLRFCSWIESSTLIPRYHKILILCISSMVLFLSRVVGKVKWQTSLGLWEVQIEYNTPQSSFQLLQLMTEHNWSRATCSKHSLDVWLCITKQWQKIDCMFWYFDRQVHFRCQREDKKKARYKSIHGCLNSYM